MAWSNFGEAFAASVLDRFYQKAVTPVVTNQSYQGDVQNMGDRVNILSFLSEVTLGDYAAGTDMDTEDPVDSETQLVIEKRKYWNFRVDRLDELFTYVDDGPDTLLSKAVRRMEREVDTYTIDRMSASVKAGHYVGYPLRVVGDGADTAASIATTATGGTLSVQAAVGSAGNRVATVELGDGTLAYGGFDSTADVGKAVRLLSGTSHATEWYIIDSVTDSTNAAIVNYDGATSGSDIPNGDVLRGLAGAPAFLGGALNADGKPTTESGWGWEIQAAFATSLTASTVYSEFVQLDQLLNDDEVPEENRHATITPSVESLLKKASELQPAIAIAYEGVIINGMVGKVAGFDLHRAAGARVSTRLEHPASSGIGADIVKTNGDRALQIVVNEIGYCTFAYKWAESRVVDAEKQFAKYYQGLHLFGAKVPPIMRRNGAMLFAIV